MHPGTRRGPVLKPVGGEDTVRWAEGRGRRRVCMHLPEAGVRGKLAGQRTPPGRRGGGEASGTGFYPDSLPVKVSGLGGAGRVASTCTGVARTRTQAREGGPVSYTHLTLPTTT